MNIFILTEKSLKCNQITLLKCCFFLLSNLQLYFQSNFIKHVNAGLPSRIQRGKNQCTLLCVSCNASLLETAEQQINEQIYSVFLKQHIYTSRVLHKPNVLFSYTYAMADCRWLQRLNYIWNNLPNFVFYLASEAETAGNSLNTYI